MLEGGNAGVRHLLYGTGKPTARDSSECLLIHLSLAGTKGARAGGSEVRRRRAAGDAEPGRAQRRVRQAGPRVRREQAQTMERQG